MVSYKQFMHFINEANSLNPYCSGRWSRTAIQAALNGKATVLILVVVDDGLVLMVIDVEAPDGTKS